VGGDGEGVAGAFGVQELRGAVRGGQRS
jgi:hypothetical protein